MELCSMLCGSLDGRRVWGRMDTCICMVEPLSCSSETITTLLTGYMPRQNVFGVKILKLKKEMSLWKLFIEFNYKRSFLVQKGSVSPLKQIVGNVTF